MCYRRGQEFYYFDFGWRILIDFMAPNYNFVIVLIDFPNFGCGTFPCSTTLAAPMIYFYNISNKNIFRITIYIMKLEKAYDFSNI